MTSPGRCIAIGASAGGVQALREVVSRLPPSLDVPVFVVLHVPAYQNSQLPEILAACGPLPAVHPVDGDRIVPGIIHVAPPDHHLLVMDGAVAVKRGPKENRFRPSIDALFRSVAYSYGACSIGVILSGALDDGTSGLWSIKQRGGLALIQDPSDAPSDSMPRSALEYVVPDHLARSDEIGELLGRLVKVPPTATEFDDRGKLLMEMEVRIAADGAAFQKGIMEIGSLTPFTCPECHGVLVRMDEGKMSRFRCHTGHAYSDSALLEGVMESTGKMLWQVIRSFEESVMLLADMASHLENAGNAERAAMFFGKARQLKFRSETFHRVALEHESLSGDNLAQRDQSS